MVFPAKSRAQNQGLPAPPIADLVLDRGASVPIILAPVRRAFSTGSPVKPCRRAARAAVNVPLGGKKALDGEAGSSYT